MKYTIKDIVSAIGMQSKVVGDPAGKFFTNVKSIYEADADSLVWVHPKKDIDISRTKAEIIICAPGSISGGQSHQEKCFVIVDDPKLAYVRVVRKLFVSEPSYGIHPSASIDEGAKVNVKAYVGPLTFIGKSTVGEGTIIHGNCHIYDGVTIGRNVIIHAGTVIGADGFGYSRNEKGEFEKFPHIGGVVIEDNVEIGANTCIDRGTLGTTVIKEGAKIDNLVHIAHNVIIGKHTAVIAHSQIAGSVVVGDYAWIAPSATISNVGTVGAGCYIGIGSVVIHSVADNEKVFGNPAKTIISPKGV